MLSLKELKRAAEGKDDRRTKLAKYLRDALKTESRRLTPKRAAVGFGCVLLVVVVAFVREKVVPRGSLLSQVPLFPLMIGVAAGLHFYYRRGAAGNAAVTAVAEGICGACTYSLQGIEPAADGCVVCPECGAAWKRERIVRPHWSAESAGVLASQTYRPPWWKAFFLAAPPSREQLAPDDRGTFVRVLDAKLHLLDPKRRKEIDPAKLRLLRRSLFATGLGLRIGLAVIPLLIAIGTFLTAAADFSQGEPDHIIGWVMLVLGFVFLLVTFAAVVSRSFRGPRAVIPVFKHHDMCPCCAESLALAGRDSAGLLVCAECRAAWRIDPASPPVTITPPASPTTPAPVDPNRGGSSPR